MNSNEKEPMHIIINGFGGLHCKDNVQLLRERVDHLENIIKRNLNMLESLKRELYDPTSDEPFDKKFRTVLSVIRDNSISVCMDYRDYYPTINKEGEQE